MSIRIEIAFSTPLDADAGIRLSLAAAAMPEVRRAVLSPDRRVAVWYGGEMACARVAAVLAEAGLAGAVSSGLAPETETMLATPAGERFRPIGR